MPCNTTHPTQFSSCNSLRHEKVCAIQCKKLTKLMQLVQACQCDLVPLLNKKMHQAKSGEVTKFIQDHYWLLLWWYAAWYVGWIIFFWNHGKGLCMWVEYVGQIIGYWFHGMRLGMWGELLVIGFMVCGLVCVVKYWLLVWWYAAWYVGWFIGYWYDGMRLGMWGEGTDDGADKDSLSAASLWRIHFYHVSPHCLLIM